MQTHAEQLAQFRTLSGLKTPAVLRVVAIILAIGMTLAIAGLVYIPWVQTAPGTGAVTALDPQDRVQNVTALVPGRIIRWHVTDGSIVKRGDPIAQIVDNDPLLLDRLRAERAQKLAEIQAAELAAQTAMLDVNRTGSLFREGLAARRDYEAAQIKVADYRAKIAQSRAAINKVDVDLSRQSAQIVRAPRDGRIMRINAGASATMVKQGDVLATFAPEESVRVVELYVDGRDVPLISAGRRVRLAFEGWPAIQFSGWPSVAQGMFDGRVRAIDLSASDNGLFRILVEPAPDRPAWPREPFVRLGAKVRGWVLMDTVPAGFELWRQLNDFPLQFQPPADPKVTAPPKEAKPDAQ
ncbi:efflux RND transporter periplasmic adaptor subunit [Sphingomonas sp. 28-63-12]|uniref:efflux RND transporter periplasmic adaptor subunit n=1 Tax=Sphingomonas sp. 28-63-12 TaxID=1970434 RepID=UPI000BCF8A9C|nr:MAG: RND transporter [Sphingomonas sp. 28-63-12]